MRKFILVYNIVMITISKKIKDVIYVILLVHHVMIHRITIALRVI